MQKQDNFTSQDTILSGLGTKIRQWMNFTILLLANRLSFIDTMEEEKKYFR